MAGLLCIIAHPDDETFCGGLLVTLARRGVPVHLLCATRGEGGGLGQPPRATRSTLGRVREAEMRCAAAALGATTVAFLDYVDPTGADGLRAPDHAPDTFRTEIGAYFGQVEAEVVLTHGSNGDYGHPAHRWVHHATRDAVATLGHEAPLLYTFNASHPQPGRPDTINYDDPARLVIDVREAHEAQAEALRCHVTQWDVFAQPPPSLEAAPAALRAYVAQAPREAYARVLPPPFDATPDALTTWLGLAPRPPGPARRHAQLRKVTRRLRRRLGRLLR